MVRWAVLRFERERFGEDRAINTVSIIQPAFFEKKFWRMDEPLKKVTEAFQNHVTENRTRSLSFDLPQTEFDD